MIEVKDIDLNLKIAESPEEAFWVELKSKSIKQLELLKHEIVINTAILELAENKILEMKKDGK